MVKITVDNVEFMIESEDVEILGRDGMHDVLDAILDSSEEEIFFNGYNKGSFLNDTESHNSLYDTDHLAEFFEELKELEDDTINNDTKNSFKDELIFKDELDLEKAMNNNYSKKEELNEKLINQLLDLLSLLSEVE